MNNKSYQQLHDEFEAMFPEFVKSVKDWTKLCFDKETRMVQFLLKNGCYILFGTMRDTDGEWTWIANLDMSDKTKEKLGVEVETTEE